MPRRPKASTEIADQQLVASGVSLELDELVSAFDRDPVEHRKRIRELMEIDSETFYSRTIEILKSGTDSRGAQYLVALLVANDFVLRAIADPALTREQAAAVARAAVRIDSMADVKIARSLAEGAETARGPLSPAETARILDILGDVSSGTRLLPSLVRLLRHSDPFLRSKAVLMAGRANRSAMWTSRRLNDPDARIRANAVEGLWGVDSESARELLHNAASDWNNRVAGNALAGLYLLGDCSTIPEILTMAAHESPLFRATAAWIMGETADPRFLEVLGGMLREPSPVVRKRAFSAIRKIKAAVQSVQPAQWVLAGRLPANEQQRALRRLWVAVASETAKHQPSILPTQFILSEEGRPVNNYKVIDRPLPETLAVVFVFPRGGEQAEVSWRQGALRCLAWKRTSDFWACLSYLQEDIGGLENPQLQNEPPAWQTDADGAAAAIRRFPPKIDCTDVWRTLWRVVHTESGGIRGKRHIILINPSPTHGIAGDELVSSLAGRASLQVISTVADPALEALCTRVSGVFEVADVEQHIPDLVARAYLRLMSRYEITWRPVRADAGEVRVRVHHPMAVGEMDLPIPPPNRG